MRTHQVFRLAIAIAAILIAGFAQAQVLNNEVEFSGVISDVVANGEGGGTLFVDITDFDLRVLVNAKTVLLNGDKEIEFGDLKENVSVLVSGKFSSSGVLATRIVVVSESPDTFRVSGHITSIDSTASPMKISLLGLVIEVDKAKFEDAAALNNGTWVYIDGTIDGPVWKASSLDIVNPGKKKGRLRFEGTVKSWDDANDLLTVIVAGQENNETKVHITADTEVEGDVKQGAYVRVTGRLVNFEVQAEKVEVVAALEIKPDEKKLKVGQTAEFTIKLREAAAAEVSVNLKVTEVNSNTNSTLVAVPPTPIVIKAGSRTGTFSVTAGSTAGTAEITATATSLGSSATALVKVGMVSEDENERPQGEARVAFAPDHIKLGLNDTREVVLLVQPPQTGLTLAVAPSPAALTAVEGRELGSGVAQRKVVVTSTGTAGTFTVTALAGTTPLADLIVEVEDKTHGNKN